MADLAHQMVHGVLVESLDSLYSTACRLTRRADWAEDLVQETARKALQNVPELRDRTKARAWIFKILVNCVRDQLRRNRDWQEYEPEIDPNAEPGGLAVLRRAASHDVRRALEQVDAPRRAVILLVDVERFTLAEAADILGVPPGTVASRLARARAQLRKLLEDYQPRLARSGGQP